MDIGIIDMHLYVDFFIFVLEFIFLFIKASAVITLVPFELQRYLVQKLPWIRYHEIPDGGHMFTHDRKSLEAILMSLLLGEEPSVS